MVVRGAQAERSPREWYRTPPPPIEALLARVNFSKRICDPCCGDGALLNVFKAKGFEVFGSDIHPVGVPEAKTVDFIKDKFPWGVTCDIVTNPPYGSRGALGVQFVRRALEVTKPWQGKVAMLLPVDFDSAASRVDIFRDHPAFTRRIPLLFRIKWFDGPAPCKPCSGSGKIEGETCARCGGAGEKDMSPAENHTWFVWDWKNSGPPVADYGW